MKRSIFHVVSNRQLTADVFELRLAGDASDFTRPGQFAEIAIPGLFLRRPISVCDWTDGSLLLLIKAVGAGTRAMRNLEPEHALDVLTGLGNGFGPAPSGAGRSVLVGGGIGIAPLFALARHLATGPGGAPDVILGFRSSSDAFYADEFTALGCSVAVATENGSAGTRGFVTDVLAARSSPIYAFACGPLPMLRAVARLPQVADGQFSFEARMGCGFGACMGCTIATADGPKRVCREGPVFGKGEVAWN